MLIKTFAILLVAAPALAHAQRAASVFPADLVAEPTGAGAFVVEAVGASAGSLLGFGVVYLTREGCNGGEDLGCVLSKVGLGILLSTVGAVAGNQLAGRFADTRPSGWGAAVGSIVGALGGVGAWHLFTEELDISNRPEVAIPAYSITQGLITAAGSSIGRALR